MRRFPLLPPLWGREPGMPSDRRGIDPMDPPVPQARGSPPSMDDVAASDRSQSAPVPRIDSRPTSLPPCVWLPPHLWGRVGVGGFRLPPPLWGRAAAGASDATNAVQRRSSFSAGDEQSHDSWVNSHIHLSGKEPPTPTLPHKGGGSQAALSSRGVN